MNNLNSILFISIFLSNSLSLASAKEEHIPSSISDEKQKKEVTAYGCLNRANYKGKISDIIFTTGAFKGFGYKVAKKLDKRNNTTLQKEFAFQLDPAGKHLFLKGRKEFSRTLSEKFYLIYNAMQHKHGNGNYIKFTQFSDGSFELNA